MKSIIKITALLIAFQLTGCGDDNEKSKKEMMTDMLTKSSWGHALVTHTPDGDLSEQYTEFAILFTNSPTEGFEGNFAISNGGYAFSETAGRWRFNDDLDTIILDSDKEMDFELDETHLRLEFVTTTPGGKMAGLSGHFVFDLQPL